MAYAVTILNQGRVWYHRAAPHPTTRGWWSLDPVEAEQFPTWGAANLKRHQLNLQACRVAMVADRVVRPGCASRG